MPSIRSLSAALLTRRFPRPARTPDAQYARLSLEPLEDRCTPATLIIDDYSVTQSLSVGGPAPPTQNIFGFVNGAGANVLGGQREVTVNTTVSPSSIRQARFDSSTNSAALSTDLQVDADMTLVYDGSADAGTQGVNATGLGGLNLAAVGTRFELVGGSDLGAAVTITVYTGAGGATVTSQTLNLPANTASTPTQLNFDFSSFTGADFSNVGAITFALDGVLNADSFLQVFCVGGTPSANLSLTKTSSTTTPQVGQNFTFTLTVTNNGPDLATGVTVTDNFPTDLTFVGSTPSQGSYTPGTGVWTVGNLANGASATLTLTARVPAGTTTESFTNTAEITTADQPDPNSTPGNGSTTEDDDDTRTVTVARDYGDAPNTYATQNGANGARHAVVSGATLFLGTTAPDAEANGQPNATATGDDNAGADDEDGVTFGTLIRGTNGTVTVVASAAGRLDAFFDFNADGDFADAGEKIFDNTAVAAGTNTLTFAIPAGATLGTTFARFRLSSAGGLGFTGFAPDGEVEDYQATVTPGTDFGDAPATYGSASHSATGVFLGTLRDIEAANQPSANADGDDTAGTDDEDGVTIGTLTAGTTATATVVASATGRVDAWLDLNGDGDFADTGEKVLNNVAVVAGTNTLNFTVPGTATPGNTFARFRVSSTGGVAATGLVADGEVEDYAATIGVGTDFGDAPATYGSASHTATGVFLGASRDAEAADQPNATATGDDAAGIDDEDGVTIGTLTRGTTATITVVASGAGFLNGYIDFNGDGDFADAGEEVFTNTALAAGTNTLTFAVPAGATPGGTFARFRFTSASVATPSPTGALPDGEVEDYAVTVSAGTDFGDAPNAYGTASHTATGVFLGAARDVEATNQPSIAADADDVLGVDDEDGVTFGTLTRAQTTTFTIVASAAGQLDAWLDLNGDGDFADAGEKTFNNVTLAAGTNTLTYTVPATAAPGNTFARFRISSTGGLTATGLAADGEVEDYAASVLPGTDFGDAPATYGTASHTATGTFLGAARDVEAANQPNATATGDDTAGTDDEDGVTIGTLAPGTTATITVFASGNGFLDGFVDFNADGDFADAGEQVFTSTALAPGNNTLTFAVPAGATTGGTFARFRVSSAGGLGATGAAADGEVEDYAVAIQAGTGTVTKSLFGTSDAGTTGSNVTIGESATFALLVNLSEGTTPGLVLVDRLPAGLQYTGFQVVTAAAASGGLLTADFNGTVPAPTVTGGAADGDDVTFTFGAIAGNPDANATNNSFLVLVTARVTNVGGNRGVNPPGQTTLTNDATFDITGDGQPLATTNTTSVPVVEPRVTITKDIAQTNVESGATVTITLTVQNTGTSAAYDVIVRDTLGTTNFAPATVAVGAAGTAYPAGFTPAVDTVNGVVAYTGGTIAAGATATFTFTVALANGVAPGAVVTNTSDVPQATSLPGTDPNERTVTAGPATDMVTVNTYSVGGTIYLDTNNDGLINGADAPITGQSVTVTLTGTNFLGIPVSLSQTTTTGTYLFTGLRPSNGAGYTVTQTTQPVGFSDGTDTPGTPFGGATSNTDSITGVVVPQNAAQNGTANAGVNYNFGELGAGISGRVFYDRDGSGLQNVTVQLFDSNGNLFRTTQSGVNGNYSFSNLPAGTYTVVETNLPGYGDTPGGPFAPNTRTVSLAAGGNVTGQDFGDTLGLIRGLVYADGDGSGTFNGFDADVGLRGVTVTLLNTGTNATVSTQTDAFGNYFFPDLLAGTYRLTETQPVGYNQATNTVGTFGGTLSATDVISAITVPAGGFGTGYNFGEAGASVSGRVYLDANTNGTFEPGVDTPLTGIPVTLTDAGGNLVRTLTTPADGTYAFVGLAAGTYTVTETQPGGLGNSEAPTNTRTFTLSAAQAVLAQDFGNTLGSLGGRVYADFNLNGVFDPGAAANPDVGIPNITVTLLNAAGAVVATTTTAADGTYLFPNLPAGIYTIVETQPPAPVSLTSGFYDGADNIGSLGGARDGKNRIAVTLGQDPATGLSQSGTGYNFGEVPPADPFGFVYRDVNRNGVRDAGEPGIAGVPVVLSGLITVVNADGTVTTRAVTAADVTGGLTRTTGADGRYEFTPIPAGVYTLTEATQPPGFADGQEQDGDPNGPPATVGNDVFTNIILAPFPVRGPFNFGEILALTPPGPLPDIFGTTTTIPGDDTSKRMFLGSTTDPAGGTTTVTSTRPTGPTSPTFTAAAPFTFTAVAGSDGYVRVFDYGSGNERFRFQPYGAFTGGVRVAVADVTGDGIPDVITAPGVGGGPVVRVFDGITGDSVANFFAFDPSFRNGFFVAAGDLTGDGRAEIIVTPDAGGGPVVTVFDGVQFTTLATFFAFDPEFRGGLRLAAGDVNRDGLADVVVTPGPGGGPVVLGYDGAALATGRVASAFPTFLALAPDFRGGMYVTVGDVDGDGFGDVVTTAGEGGGPWAGVFGGRGLAQTDTAATVTTLFVGDPAGTSGARVAARDLTADGRAELIAGPGSGAPVVSVVSPLTGATTDTFTAFSLAALGGVFVA